MPEHAAWHRFYRRLLTTRREILVPMLPLIGANAGSFDVIGAAAVVVRWQMEHGGELTLAANLSGARVPGFPGSSTADRTLWQEGKLDQNGVSEPWSVRWSTYVGAQ
jgi:1,4-alpha-glucan branching enzyme